MEILNAVRGASFRSKIERLENSFAAASGPFHAEIRRLEIDSTSFQAKVDAGQAQWVEVDDEGHHVDYGSDLAERRDDALDALATLRQAYVFLIYHQWERFAQHWAKPGKAPNHDDLVKSLKKAGRPLDEPNIEILRLLANTLKHNSSKYGVDLYQRRPDLFASDFDPSANNPVTGKPFRFINWADHVALTDSQIDHFIRVVRLSAPR